MLPTKARKGVMFAVVTIGLHQSRFRSGGQQRLLGGGGNKLIGPSDMKQERMLEMGGLRQEILYTDTVIGDGGNAIAAECGQGRQ